MNRRVAAIFIITDILMYKNVTNTYLVEKLWLIIIYMYKMSNNTFNLL